MFRSILLKYVLPLLGLTVSAFIFNTSEFMPIGLLMDISQSFAMTESQTGIMITVYAWVVALLSLPLMLLVCQMEMRRLLLGTMGLFVLGQLASGLALNFPMLMAARISVACAHSIFWSIAAPIATRLVTRTHRPLALSMIVTGSAVAMIFGLPLGRIIGLYAGWRMTFLTITATALAVLLYLAFVFPKLASDASFPAMTCLSCSRIPSSSVSISCLSCLRRPISRRTAISNPFSKSSLPLATRESRRRSCFSASAAL